MPVQGYRPNDRVKKTEQQRDGRTLPRATRPTQSDGLACLDAEFVVVADTVQGTGGVAKIWKGKAGEGGRSELREMVAVTNITENE